MFDPLDTPENWRKITNCSLKLGECVKCGNHKYAITGFGPYFLWAKNIETGSETRLTSWETIS